MTASKAILITLLFVFTSFHFALAQVEKNGEKDSPAEEEKAEKIVSIFPDKNLEAVVRRNVFEKRDNDEPLTAEDVENISTIEGKGKAVRDLRGLEKCISLALLDLDNNDIADIDPISELKNLQSINLARNRIGDLTALAKLERLQYLHLAHNRIVDVEPISGLKNLRSLYLSDNKIKDLQPLAELEKVWSLYLDNNQVKSLKPIAKMKWLSSLDLRQNRLKDLEPLSSLTELKYLAIEKNQISDLSTLLRMAEKDAASEQRFAPFWRIYLADNPLSDEAKAQLKKIQKLGGRISEKAIPE